MMNLIHPSIETAAAAQRALPKLIACVGSDYRFPAHTASRFPVGKGPRENQQGTWATVEEVRCEEVSLS
jgi:hypothetical protein